MENMAIIGRKTSSTTEMLRQDGCYNEICDGVTETQTNRQKPAAKEVC